MKLPCDNCKLKDIICGLVGSRKHAANAVDRIMEEVEDGLLEIPIICHGWQGVESEPYATKGQILTSGACADGDVQGLLQAPCGNGGCGSSDDESLYGLSFGTPCGAGEGSTGEDHGGNG